MPQYHPPDYADNTDDKSQIYMHTVWTRADIRVIEGHLSGGAYNEGDADEE